MAPELTKAEAQRLLAAARHHKRVARRHRRRANELMDQLRNLIDAAAARGIRIDINTAEPNLGGHSGHHPYQQDEA